MPRGRGRGRGRGGRGRHGQGRGQRQDWLRGCTDGAESGVPPSVEPKESGPQSSAVRPGPEKSQKDVDWTLRKHVAKNKLHAEEKAHPFLEEISESPQIAEVPCISKRPRMAVMDDYLKELESYKEPPALDWDESVSCTFSPQMPPNSSFTKKCMVLSAAKFVLSLSSFIDGTQINQCSGILIESDEKRRSSTILTSSHLFCTKPCLDEWSTGNKYAPQAEIHVQMLDKTTIKAHMLYYQAHYGLAFLEIVTDQLLPVASFEPEVQYSQEVLTLGRDEDLHLHNEHHRVPFLNAPTKLRNHYLCLDGSVPKFGIGGPVINHNGKVVGMAAHATPGTCAAFIPSSVILNCFRLWKELDWIPRPSFGLKLWDMELLDPAHIEMIVRKCNVSTGLIVQEVSEGSICEKQKIRPGDVIVSCNGDHISSRIEFENKLLQMVQDNVRNRSIANSNVNLKVTLYVVRKGITKDVQLTTIISDVPEVFA